MSKKILVTGGAGYIGSHIVHDLIELGYDVTILDNLSKGEMINVHPSSTFIEGDVRDEKILSKIFSKGIDVVFHFAALKAAGESMFVPHEYANNNIFGTLQLLSKMNEYKINYFVFSSSAAVYGSPVKLPIDEQHPVKPINYYGYTKLAIEENLAWFSQLTNLRYAALRYFNATGYDVKKRIKGKEKNPANLCPIIMEVLSGERKEMQIFGNDYNTPDGTCIRDYIHVNDLASAHIKALEYITGENKNLVVNLGTGNGYSVLDLINAAEKVSGKKVNYKIAERRAGDPESLVADFSLANKLINWEAEYSSPEQIFESMLPVYFK